MVSGYYSQNPYSKWIFTSSFQVTMTTAKSKFTHIFLINAKDFTYFFAKLLLMPVSQR